MRITSWLKDWLVTPGIDDSWVARAEEEMQREAEEWAAASVKDMQEKKTERAVLKLMRDIYGDKS
ncbi:transcription modulator [Escherichia phage PSD2001]|nr:transcription modulator [Escherichia phage PSD2001]